jgi:predicted phosphate transport protein (TIGR00153 family)
VKLGGRIRNLASELSGRSGRQFADLLGAQVAATLEGAELVRSGTTKRHAPSAGDVRDEMSEVEHRGDRARGKLIEQLSRSMVTPIDREDLFRVSRSVDDVLDNLRDFAREVDLYDVADRRFAKPILKALIEGIEALAVAVEALAGSPYEITEATLSARKSAGLVRRLYQEALGTLFASEPDVETLKQYELLRRLDIVGLSLGEAADALADGAVKRQQ